MMVDRSTPHTPEVEEFKEALYAQLMRVMGVKHPNRLTRAGFSIFNSPVDRMSRLLVELDHNTDQNGWSSAVNQFLKNFISEVELIGEEGIPPRGPLMVVCNHPAAYDAAILGACIKRDDLKMMASDIPLIQMLPNIREHMIPVPYYIPARLQTVRSTIRHLQNGGSVLVFPRGDVEPDPAVSPGAEKSLEGWSASIELFLRRVPQTVSVVGIASGILSKRWYQNPLINLWKKYEQRQKVAEIFQVSYQLLTGRRPNVKPLISFSAPLTIAELGGESAPEGTLLACFIEQARRLLLHHPHV
jgi:Acyltransferase